MKRTHLLRFALAIGAICTLFTINTFANPGTSTDPLVSKSYVDDQIAQVVALIQSKLGGQTTPPTNPNTAAIVDEVILRITPLLQQSGSNSGGTGTPAATFTPVQVKAGQTLFGGEGCEIILRSGKAATSIAGENGITDVTAGNDIGNNTYIFENHMLIIPRDDGRGILAVTDCWFLVKGTYRTVQ